MSNCINKNHPEVVKLAGELNVSPAVAAAKIGVWQTKNNIFDRFPTKDEINKKEEIKIDDNSLKPILLKSVESQLSEYENENNESILSEKSNFVNRAESKSNNKKLVNNLFNDKQTFYRFSEIIKKLNSIEKKNSFLYEVLNKINKLPNVNNVIVRPVVSNQLKNEDTIMQYDPNTKEILFSIEVLEKYSDEAIASSFLHEIVHYITEDVLSKNKSKLTYSEKEFVNVVNNFYNKYKSYNHGNFKYGFKNEFEFIAEFYSNPDFREYTKSLSDNWYNKFVKELIEALRHLFNLKNTPEYNKLLEISYNYIENGELFKDEDSLYVFKPILSKEIKESESYDLTSIDKKVDHLILKTKDKVTQLINRTKKSSKKDDIKKEFLKSYRELLEEIEKLETVNKWKAITSYVKSFSNTLSKLRGMLNSKHNYKNVTYLNINYDRIKNTEAYKDELNKLIIIPEDIELDTDFLNSYKNYDIKKDSNLFNNIENEAIKSFSEKDFLDITYQYEDYLNSYDLLDSIKTLILETEKDSTLTRDEKLEIKTLKALTNSLSQPHDEIVSELKLIKKESIIKLLSDSSTNKKVINKWKNKLEIEYNKIKSNISKEEWIANQLETTYKKEFENSLKEDASKVVNNPYLDITSFAKNWMDLLNINSPLINLMSNVIGKMRDNIIKEINESAFKFDKIFKKYSEFNNSISMSKKYGNLVELNETTDRYYLKGKYSIKFLENFNKMISELKESSIDKLKTLAVQEINLDALKSKNKTIFVRNVNDHEYKINDVLQIKSNNINTGLIVKIKKIHKFSDFNNLSEERKNQFAKLMGDYNSFEDFKNKNKYLNPELELYKQYPDLYNFINNNGQVDILEYELIKEDSEQIKLFKKNNDIYKKWLKENTILEGEVRVPHPKYLNKSLSSEEQKVVDFFINETINNNTEKYDGKSGLIKTKFGATFYMLPSKTKSSKERTLEGDIKGQIKDQITDLTTTKVDDINYGEAFDSTGNELRRLKINYRGKISSKDQSLDLFTVYRDENDNAIIYYNRKQNENKLKLFLDIARDKTYKKKSLLTGGWALNFFSKKEIQGQTFSGEHSNELQKIKGLLETHLYDVTSYNEEKLLGKMDSNKLVSKVNGLAASISMTLNLGSGFVNLLNGKTMLLLESLSKGSINKSNMIKSESRYFKDLPNILADISNPVKKSFTNQMLNMFDAVGGLNISKQDFLNNSTIKELLSSHNANFINESGEHFLSAILVESILRGIPVMNSNKKFININGNEVSKEEAASLFDMLYLDSDGILRMNNKVSHTSYNLLDDYHKTGKQSINFLIKKNIHNLYGVYDNNFKAEIHKHWYGKLVMMFKNFFISQMEYRYKGIKSSDKNKEDLDDEELTFNNAEQQYTEGIYTTFIRTFFPLLKGFNVAMVKENYKNLSDYEKANLNKAFIEISITAIILPVLGALLGAAAGDDDDEIYFLLFAFRRLESELSQFRNIAELNRMISNPVAANRFLQNGFTVINDIFTPINFNPNKNESYFDYLSEDSKGNNKMLNHAFKLAPGGQLFLNTYKQRYNLIDK